MKFSEIKRKELIGTGGLYIIKNDIDKRVYIGSAKDFYNRLQHHKNALEGNYSGCVKLQKFVSKYGLDSLNIEMICIDINRDELYKKEEELIREYNSVETGFNCSYETKTPQIPKH